VHIDHAAGRDAFVDELRLLLEIADGLSDHDLLAASRCRGWTVADVLAHVHLGLQEMLLGIVSPTEDPATVDAATYWAQAPSGNDGDASDTDHVRYVRMLSSAYQKPVGGIRHLCATGSAVMRAATRLLATNLDFQGHVIGTGDFYATWAVELAVHHLDLGLELMMEPPATAALSLARETVEQLAGGPFPPDLAQIDVVLIGTGRLPAPPLDHRFTGLTVPAFG
jgi:Mycothiol maleylpyruvate isomerase N-terminal domain